MTKPFDYANLVVEANMFTGNRSSVPKFLFFAVTLTLSFVAQANCLDIDGILRAGDPVLAPIKCNGEIIYMNQPNASVACPIGTHLPTIRKLAEKSQELGAKGILEKSEVTGEPPSGYYLVSASNPGKSIDEFYFSPEGYRRPKGDLGHDWFWSSSVHSDGSISSYMLYGARGNVTSDYWEAGAAIRCFSGSGTGR